MYSRLCLAFLLLFTLPVLLSACSWIKDLQVAVKDIEEKRYSTTINGCIQRTAFDGKVLKHLEVRNQTIGNLGEDTVKNLDELVKLVFEGCKIDSISPRAFRNLPKILNIELSHGNTNEIPRNVFNLLPSIRYISINDNEIDLIEEQAFANLYTLDSIHANNNKLEYWNRNWFANNTALSELHFERNLIRTIPRRAFANIPYLQTINFDENEISVIQPDAFLGLTNLFFLGLRYNRLTEIREDIFPHKLSIRTFILNANYLNFLPERLLQKMSVIYISVDNNPWKCPCLDRIHFWLNRTNGTKGVDESCIATNSPICAIPTTYSRSCFESVDPDLTERYMRSLRNIRPPLPKYCARTDGFQP